MKWVEKHIEVNPCKNPKKITGTRFGAILGTNKWTTPFEVWCAITRTYEEPFVETIYTIAGKTIEPKQAQYISEQYFWRTILTPEQKYGKDYFNKLRGDFFADKPIFGGMWDYLFVNAKGEPEAVLEMKTTKRAEDWADGIPEYYALQAALYAYLLGVDEVIMVCTVLEEKEYEKPEDFVVTPENTFERKFKVSERYPNFKELVNRAFEWYHNHVDTGISPDYDEKKDAEIIKILKSNNVNPDTELEQLIAEAEVLQAKIDAYKADIADEEKRLKNLKDQIKEVLYEQFREGDTKVVTSGNEYEWTLSKSLTFKVNEKAMKADGILDKYKTLESETVRLTNKKKEG